MKKMITLVAAVCIAVCNAFAGNDILTFLEQKGDGFKTLEAGFTQVRTLAANGRKTTSEGQLYYAENRFAMHYAPGTDELLIINGKDFYMIRGKKKNLYNTETNKVMGSLKNTLLLCMTGDLESLAEDNDADLAAKADGNVYEIVLTARQKAARGYSEIRLAYDRNSAYLMEMTMTEFNGNSTVYSMSGYKKNASIPDTVFAIRGSR